MKTTIALAVLTLLLPVAASAQNGRVNLSSLDRLAERASEKQEVTIDSSMLKGSFPFVPSGPKGDAAKQILSQLEGIYVRSYEFEKDKTVSMDDIQAIRKQLATPGWSKIVSNEQKGKGPSDWELQEVWLFNPGGKLGGVFIINAEPGEMQVINIVGPIDLEKLKGLGGVLGIPNNIGIN